MSKKSTSLHDIMKRTVKMTEEQQTRAWQILSDEIKQAGEKPLSKNAIKRIQQAFDDLENGVSTPHGQHHSKDDDISGKTFPQLNDIPYPIAKKLSLINNNMDDLIKMMRMFEAVELGVRWLLAIYITIISAEHSDHHEQPDGFKTLPTKLIIELQSKLARPSFGIWRSILDLTETQVLNDLSSKYHKTIHPQNAKTLINIQSLHDIISQRNGIMHGGWHNLGQKCQKLKGNVDTILKILSQNAHLVQVFGVHDNNVYHLVSDSLQVTTTHSVKENQNNQIYVVWSTEDKQAQRQSIMAPLFTIRNHQNTAIAHTDPFVLWSYFSSRDFTDPKKCRFNCIQVNDRGSTKMDDITTKHGAFFCRFFAVHKKFDIPLQWKEYLDRVLREQPTQEAWKLDAIYASRLRKALKKGLGAVKKEQTEHRNTIGYWFVGRQRTGKTALLASILNQFASEINTRQIFLFTFQQVPTTPTAQLDQLDEMLRQFYHALRFWAQDSLRLSELDPTLRREQLFDEVLSLLHTLLDAKGTDVLEQFQITLGLDGLEHIDSIIYNNVETTFKRIAKKATITDTSQCFFVLSEQIDQADLHVFVQTLSPTLFKPLFSQGYLTWATQQKRLAKFQSRLKELQSSPDPNHVYLDEIGVERILSKEFSLQLHNTKTHWDAFLQDVLSKIRLVGGDHYRNPMYVHNIATLLKDGEITLQTNTDSLTVLDTTLASLHVNNPVSDEVRLIIFCLCAIEYHDICLAQTDRFEHSLTSTTLQMMHDRECIPSASKIKIIERGLLSAKGFVRSVSHLHQNKRGQMVHGWKRVGTKGILTNDSEMHETYLEVKDAFAWLQQSLKQCPMETQPFQEWQRRQGSASLLSFEHSYQSLINASATTVLNHKPTSPADRLFDFHKSLLMETGRVLPTHHAWFQVAMEDYVRSNGRLTASSINKEAQGIASHISNHMWLKRVTPNPIPTRCKSSYFIRKGDNSTFYTFNNDYFGFSYKHQYGTNFQIFHISSSTILFNLRFEDFKDIHIESHKDSTFELLILTAKTLEQYRLDLAVVTTTTSPKVSRLSKTTNNFTTISIPNIIFSSHKADCMVVDTQGIYIFGDFRYKIKTKNYTAAFRFDRKNINMFLEHWIIPGTKSPYQPLVTPNGWFGQSQTQRNNGFWSGKQKTPDVTLQSVSMTGKDPKRSPLYNLNNKCVGSYVVRKDAATNVYDAWVFTTTGCTSLNLKTTSNIAFIIDLGSNNFLILEKSGTIYTTQNPSKQLGKTKFSRFSGFTIVPQHKAIIIYGTPQALSVIAFTGSTPTILSNKTSPLGNHFGSSAITDCKVIDKNRFISISEDNDLRIWKLSKKSFECVDLLRYHKNKVRRIHVLPNQQTVLSHDDSGIALRWELPKTAAKTSEYKNSLKKDTPSGFVKGILNMWDNIWHIDDKASVYHVCSTKKQDTTLSDPTLIEIQQYPSFKLFLESITIERVLQQLSNVVLLDKEQRLWHIDIPTAPTNILECVKRHTTSLVLKPTHILENWKILNIRKIGTNTHLLKDDAYPKAYYIALGQKVTHENTKHLLLLDVEGRPIKESDNLGDVINCFEHHTSVPFTTIIQKNKNGRQIEYSILFYDWFTSNTSSLPVPHSTNEPKNITTIHSTLGTKHHKILLSDRPGSVKEVHFQYIEFAYNAELTSQTAIRSVACQHPNIVGSGPSGKRVFDQSVGLLIHLPDRQCWKLEPDWKTPLSQSEMNWISIEIDQAYQTYFDAIYPSTYGTWDKLTSKPYIASSFNGGLHLFYTSSAKEELKEEKGSIQQISWVGADRKGYLVTHDEAHGRIWVKQNREIIVLQLMRGLDPIGFPDIVPCPTPSDDEG